MYKIQPDKDIDYSTPLKIQKKGLINFDNKDVNKNQKSSSNFDDVFYNKRVSESDNNSKTKPQKPELADYKNESMNLNLQYS